MGRLPAGVAHQHYDRERAHRGERIGGQVDQHARGADLVRDHDADQDEAGVRDRGVRQHALDVGLGHRHDRAEQHRDDRHEPEHRLPVGTHAAEGDIEDAQHGAEGRDLRHGRHEAGDRRGSALVGVRRPLVERCRTDLEQQPDRDERHAGQQQAVLPDPRGHRGVDAGEGDGAGIAVDQCQAEQEERRRVRPEQEVLHRRFL